MHHTPAVMLGENRHNNTGLRRMWWPCCRQENIAPRKPTRLPLLFALDAKLGIAGGFHYQADCGGPRRQGESCGNGAVHCGGDMGNSSYDGGTDGFGDSGSDGGGDSGSDGGGGGGD